MTAAARRKLSLPWPAQPWLERAARDLLAPANGPTFDFLNPPGEPALVAPGAVSWRVFENPVALFIGGVTAVILELAEPRVRTGVWEHTTFRDDPAGRIARTGLAAMATVYGARSKAEAMISGVNRAHARVRGTTPGGVPYAADDPELLTYVQATAAFGFLEAYSVYVRPLATAERDRALTEGAPAALLYGARAMPTTDAALADYLKSWEPKLEHSDIVFEFLALMRRAPILPLPLRPLQGALVRAAIAITPQPVLDILELTSPPPTSRRFAPVRALGAVADRVRLDAHPAAQAHRRLGMASEL